MVHTSFVLWFETAPIKLCIFQLTLPVTTTEFSILAAEMLQAQDVDLIVIKALVVMCIRIGGVIGGTGKRIIADPP